MIFALLPDSALRSLALGAIVWLILKLLRVRNPHVQMTAWTVVLIASLSMPAMLGRVTVRLPAGALPSPLMDIVGASLWDAVPPRLDRMQADLAPQHAVAPDTVAPAIVEPARYDMSVALAGGQSIGGPWRSASMSSLPAC